MQIPTVDERHYVSVRELVARTCALHYSVFSRETIPTWRNAVEEP
jgi:hypothetical protein